MSLEDPLLSECTPTKNKACARFYHEVVAEHTGGQTIIKPGTRIPFTCNVYEKILVNVNQARLPDGKV